MELGTKSEIRVMNRLWTGIGEGMGKGMKEGPVPQGPGMPEVA